MSDVEKACDMVLMRTMHGSGGAIHGSDEAMHGSGEAIHGSNEAIHGSDEAMCGKKMPCMGHTKPYMANRGTCMDEGCGEGLESRNGVGREECGLVEAHMAY